MSADQCRQWRGALAGRAMGLPDPASDPALDAHLDGCADCRADVQELRAVAAAAKLADPARLGTSPVAPPLADRIMAKIALESAASARRRRRRRLGVAVSSAAAVTAVVVLGFGLIDDDPAPVTRIELAGVAGVDGSAELTERAWGTEVTLEVSGLDEGEVYWLWLSDADDRRVTAGSLTGTGEPVRAVLSSGLSADDARRIWMTDDDDRVVLDAAFD